MPANGRMSATRASGITVALAGIAFVTTGFWARREVRTTLARERIVEDSSPVKSGPAARSLSESIRRSALDAAGGRTYAETDTDEPAHELWLQATTLQTALMQAYMGSRLAELTMGLGAAFVAAGVGLVAAER